MLKKKVRKNTNVKRDPYGSVWNELLSDKYFKMYAKEVALNRVENKINNFITMLKLDDFRVNYRGRNAFGSHSINIYDSKNTYYLVHVDETTVEVHDVNVNVLFKSKHIDETFNWFLENINS